MTEQIRVLIVDDEELARIRIRRLLEKFDDVTIAGEAADGGEAIEKIEELNPDLVFLDIQMPETDGFAVLSSLDPEKMPVIIFVTAYDKYALKAFEVHAVDYLLKPFDDLRFFDALSHARELLAGHSEHEFKMRNLNEAVRSEKWENYQLRDKIVVRTGGKICFLKTADIVSIKAAGKYIEIMANRQKYLVRQAIGEIERMLNPEQFLRIHRSVIINLDYVSDMQHWSKGDYLFQLNNGDKYISSAGYREAIEQILQIAV